MAWVALFSLSAMQEAADMLMECTGLNKEKLYQFLMGTLPGKEALEAKKNQSFWNPIFN